MSMRAPRIGSVLAGIGAIGLIATACGSSGGSGGSGGSSTPASTPAPTSSAVTSSSATSSGAGMTAVMHSAKGEILTVGGRTVYYFDNDTKTSSNCSGQCASTWPAVAAPLTPATGVTAADIGQITGTSGSPQATYFGHPLYTFSGDTAAGQVNGDGIGGVWHVVVPSKLASAASSSAPAPMTSSSRSGGGGGY